MQLLIMRSEVLTVVLLEIQVFWEVKQQHWVAIRDIPKNTNNAFKTLQSTYKMMHCHIPEDLKLQLLILRL
jgi:hypothetical protein